MTVVGRSNEGRKERRHKARLAQARLDSRLSIPVRARKPVLAALIQAESDWLARAVSIASARGDHDGYGSISAMGLTLDWARGERTPVSSQAASWLSDCLLGGAGSSASTMFIDRLSHSLSVIEDSMDFPGAARETYVAADLLDACVVLDGLRAITRVPSNLDGLGWNYLDLLDSYAETAQCALDSVVAQEIGRALFSFMSSPSGLDAVQKALSLFPHVRAQLERRELITPEDFWLLPIMASRPAAELWVDLVSATIFSDNDNN